MYICILAQLNYVYILQLFLICNSDDWAKCIFSNGKAKLGRTMINKIIVTPYIGTGE